MLVARSIAAIGRLLRRADWSRQSATTTVGSRSLTFTSTLKVLAVFDRSGKSVTTLTSSGTTATATVTAHGYTTGADVTIAGATQTEYNGEYSITVTGANTFTYVFDDRQFVEMWDSETNPYEPL